MRNLKTLGIAGGFVAAALVGGTLISVVAAAPSASSPNAAPADSVNTARYCDLWQKTFAAKLNVSVDAAVAAAKAATIATIDAAAAAGDLTAAQATALKAAIDKADGSGCRLLGAAFRGLGRHVARVEFKTDLLGSAADALGMDKAALVAALRGGESLQKITTAKGKDYATVSKAVHDAAKADLDAIVTAGHLKQAREDAILSQLDKWLATGGSLPLGPGWGRAFGGLASVDTLPAA